MNGYSGVIFKLCIVSTILPTQRKHNGRGGLLTLLLLLGRPPSLVLLDAARAVGADRGAVDAGVLLLRLVLLHVVALTGRARGEERRRLGEKGKRTKNKKELACDERRLTEQLFFLLAPMGDSLMRMGAIFLALAAAFFFSGTRGLLLRFL